MKINAKDYLGFLINNISELASKYQPLWHPLGFVSCEIFREDVGVLRIHYWPPGERRVKNPDWPIHTHSYYLSSYIISGQIRDIRYRVKPHGTYTAYKVKYNEGGSEIVRLNRNVGIEPIFDITRLPTESYEIDLGIFHQSIVPFDESAITLVGQSNFDSISPIVLGEEGETSYPYIREPFDKEIFWSVIGCALSITLNKPLKHDSASGAS